MLKLKQGIFFIIVILLGITSCEDECAGCEGCEYNTFSEDFVFVMDSENGPGFHSLSKPSFFVEADTSEEEHSTSWKVKKRGKEGGLYKIRGKKISTGSCQPYVINSVEEINTLKEPKELFD